MGERRDEGVIISRMEREEKRREEKRREKREYEDILRWVDNGILILTLEIPSTVDIQS